MARAKQFLPRLYSFAESFTGCPVRLIVAKDSTLTENEMIDSTSALKIYIPSKVDTDSEESAFNIYKGIVSLQASAITYGGIVEEGKEEEFSKKLHSNSLEQVADEGSRGSLIPTFYNVCEISRRMQCLAQDYPILGEDMADSFSYLFDEDLLKRTHTGESRYLMFEMGDEVNEIDLALSRTYWENLGVSKDVIESVVREIAEDTKIGGCREELHSTFQGLCLFGDPLKTSYQDTMQRVEGFRDYIRELCSTLELGSLLASYKNLALSMESHRRSHSLSDQVIRSIDKKIEKLLLLLDKDPKTLPTGLRSHDSVKNRIKELKERRRSLGSRELSLNEVMVEEHFESIIYRTEKSTADSIELVFREVPKKQLIQLEVPKEILEQQGSKRVKYLPELREGALVPRSVRAVIYDLEKNQPQTEQQSLRESRLERRISGLMVEIGDLAEKIDIDYQTFWDERDRNRIKKREREKGEKERELKQTEKELAESRKTYKEISKRPVEINKCFSRRLQGQMEKIKPEARSRVRGCFSGEVDVRRYFDYWLKRQAGEHPNPNYYYQWQKRKRDIGSILLIDSSESMNRISQGNRTILDYVKEAAYDFVVGADALEDKSAVIAYNGRGDKNFRLFLLKDFQEDQRVLEERLRLLRGELNNRDGAGIRFATNFLKSLGTKTKFLYHLSDMKPSDLEFETSKSVFVTNPYEGDLAYNDVTHAFNSARSFGITPVGICIREPEKTARSEDAKGSKPKPSGKVNLAVLKRLKSAKAKISGLSLDERLKKNFKRNYRIIKSLDELPEVLRDIYIRTSFRR